jgi:hypothetical protein
MAILDKAPAGARVLDLEAYRAARAESLADVAPPVIKIAAGFVELRPDLDVLAADDFTTGKIRAGLAKILLDPADVDAIVDGGLTKPDLDAIVGFVTGHSLGE